MKKIVTIFTLLITTQIYAANDNERLDLLEAKIVQLQTEIAELAGKKSSSLVDTTLLELDEYLEDKGISLEIAVEYKDEKIKKFSSYIQTCFASLERDFPDLNLPINKVALWHSNGDVRLWDDDKTLVFKSHSTAQSCYTLMYQLLKK